MSDVKHTLELLLREFDGWTVEIRYEQGGFTAEMRSDLGQIVAVGHKRDLAAAINALRNDLED